MIKSITKLGHKQMKKVEWNGMIFESIAKLCLYNKVYPTGANLGKYIKSGKPWKGHVIKRVESND